LNELQVACSLVHCTSLNCIQTSISIEPGVEVEVTIADA